MKTKLFGDQLFERKINTTLTNIYYITYIQGRELRKITYHATRVYKYIHPSVDCIVLHWGKGNRFRSLRPTFLEDKLEKRKQFLIISVSGNVSSIGWEHIALRDPKKVQLCPGMIFPTGNHFYVTFHQAQTLKLGGVLVFIIQIEIQFHGFFLKPLHVNLLPDI